MGVLDSVSKCFPHIIVYRCHMVLLSKDRIYHQPLKHNRTVSILSQKSSWTQAKIVKYRGVKNFTSVAHSGQIVVPV